MGVWVLHDHEQDRAVLYDSTTERPFGPGFCGPCAREEADGFLRFLLAKTGRPIVGLEASFLEQLHDEWLRRTRCETCGREIDFNRLTHFLPHLSNENFLIVLGEDQEEPFTCATMAENSVKIAQDEEVVQDGRTLAPEGVVVDVRFINARARSRCASLRLEVVRG